ncbi:MAG: signal peptide peptidase SppA [Planctomycetota bacterium]
MTTQFRLIFPDYVRVSVLVLVIFLTGCIFVDFKPKELYQEKFISGNEKSVNKVLILPINGIIMNEEAGGFFSKDACTPEKIREQLQLAGRDKDIKAIILEIDSPGGGVTASDIIYQNIKEFKKQKPDLPIVVLMKDTAASGGYYIAMAGDYIIAHRTSITGSIGVISLFVIVEELLEKIKVDVEIIKSGEVKDMGSPFKKMSDKERELIQSIVNEMYQRFVNVVVEGRKDVLTREEILKLADGRVFTGQMAYDKKLIDAVGYLADAEKKAQEIAHLSDSKVIRYERVKSGLGAAFSLENPLGEINFLKQLVLRDGTSRFMYLWWPAGE